MNWGQRTIIDRPVDLSIGGVPRAGQLPRRGGGANCKEC